MRGNTSRGVGDAVATASLQTAFTTETFMRQMPRVVQRFSPSTFVLDLNVWLPGRIHESWFAY